MTTRSPRQVIPGKNIIVLQLFKSLIEQGNAGPYEELVRYEGFPIFARDMDMAINSPPGKS